MTVEELTTVQVPTLAVQLPGRTSNPGGKVTPVGGVVTSTGAAPLLVIVKVLATTLPGPVQTSGSVTAKLTRLTEMVKLHVAVLLDASVAVQVTVVVPRGKFAPEGGLQATVAPGQLSVGVGVV